MSAPKTNDAENRTASRNSRSASHSTWPTVAVVLLVVLAIVATVTMLVTSSALWTRIAVVVALWAAVLGAFVMMYYQRRANQVTAHAGLMAEDYQRQLQREIDKYDEQEAARRAEIEEAARLEMEQLRAELTAMRIQLSQMFGPEFDEQLAIGDGSGDFFYPYDNYEGYGDYGDYSYGDYGQYGDGYSAADYQSGYAVDDNVAEAEVVHETQNVDTSAALRVEQQREQRAAEQEMARFREEKAEQERLAKVREAAEREAREMEQKRAEQERAEQERLERERAEEQRRKAEEERRIEQERQRELAERRAAQERRAEQERLAAEERRKADEKRRQEEQRRTAAAEAARRAEEEEAARHKAEEERLAEEERRAAAYRAAAATSRRYTAEGVTPPSESEDYVPRRVRRAAAGTSTFNFGESTSSDSGYKPRRVKQEESQAPAATTSTATESKTTPSRTTKRKKDGWPDFSTNFEAPSAPKIDWSDMGTDSPFSPSSYSSPGLAGISTPTPSSDTSGEETAYVGRRHRSTTSESDYQPRRSTEARRAAPEPPATPAGPADPTDDAQGAHTSGLSLAEIMKRLEES